MEQIKKDKLIQELNEKLKNVTTGDDIREVFFTMVELHFTPAEIAKVFENVKISDEKIALIEENDKTFKR